MTLHNDNEQKAVFHQQSQTDSTSLETHHYMTKAYKNQQGIKGAAHLGTNLQKQLPSRCKCPAPANPSAGPCHQSIRNCCTKIHKDTQRYTGRISALDKLLGLEIFVQHWSIMVHPHRWGALRPQVLGSTKPLGASVPTLRQQRHPAQHFVRPQLSELSVAGRWQGTRLVLHDFNFCVLKHVYVHIDTCMNLCWIVVLYI